ncbi:uncharacterized protein Z518_01195 [Rhinocladiella mackenziei CBS 650.93]|uniref:Myb-like DNA-binding domain-containing protein n=1 Tax=Rhinocladiella mackenziei CBS 650.93 TaxID=1442369 RepID=A0A0D2IVP9_9EURO|nr:uncharacterized protein Z518_01195 [Rhinocladiella mackenziei CBS 650.93]KIX10114.1 hypothetical protein Z518_01195 [Rhinocladiella mackenziei CBS 650.93]
MAPEKTDNDDLRLIMTCIKHAENKLAINFEEVAKELGAKSANAAYHRHWGLMRKWGLTGSKKGGTLSTRPTKHSAGDSAKLSGRNRQATNTEAEGSDEDDNGDGQPMKKQKVAHKKNAVGEDTEKGEGENGMGGSNGDGAAIKSET